MATILILAIIANNVSLPACFVWMLSTVRSVWPITGFTKPPVGQPAPIHTTMTHQVYVYHALVPAATVQHHQHAPPACPLTITTILHV